MVLRRASFSSLSALVRPERSLSSSSGSLQDGQRLAKPGLSGRSSNSSPHATQVRIGKPIAFLS